MAPDAPGICAANTATTIEDAAGAYGDTGRGKVGARDDEDEGSFAAEVAAADAFGAVPLSGLPAASPDGADLGII